MTFKDSFIFRIICLVSEVFNASFIKSLADRLGRLFGESCICRLIRAYIGGGMGILRCKTVGLMNACLSAAEKPCDRLLSLCEGSLILKLLKKITEHKAIFLYILISYPFTDLLIRKTAGALAGPWDELYFFGLLLILGLDFLFDHKDRKYVVSPLDLPLVIFLAVMYCCYFVVSPDRKIGFEGLRAVCEYMFWFFLILKLCDSDKLGKRLCICLFVIMGIMAVHGIYQYITAAPMPTSWVDHNEAGVRTRVYSILTSPNVLGCLFTMTIPIGAGLFLEETNRLKKLFYGIITLCMLASLAFTFSRGAWVGFMGAVFVFVVFYDARLLIPVVVLGLLIIFLVPEIGGRISYMLSPEYIESSMNGGRLIRWIDGLKVWAYGKYAGVGLGHFGGAVAMNHGMQYLVADEYIDTFYMDNYYLKTMIETGVIGLAAFVFLMYEVFINSIRAVCISPDHRYLKTGIMSGLFGVIIHNAFENIFEVPMASTYFWILAAVLMGFWYRKAAEK